MYTKKNVSVRFLKPLLFFFLIAALFLSCNRRGGGGDALDRDTSYAFGMLMASQLAGMGFMELSFDYDAFTAGFRDFNEARETRLTQERAMDLIYAVLDTLQAQENERHWLEAERTREIGEAYMAENRTRNGVTTTPSGLQYEVITQGSGRRPSPDDIVRVHYEGTFIDGNVFDSSYRRGEPIEFNLRAVIAGWIEGLQLMNVGSIYRFVIPPELAYGPGGTGPIPPNSTLIFQVELLAIIE
jgi:FKBP-type peptidyl-prolyl cis-trans isomerase